MAKEHPSPRIIEIARRRQDDPRLRLDIRECLSLIANWPGPPVPKHLASIAGRWVDETDLLDEEVRECLGFVLNAARDREARPVNLPPPGAHELYK